MHVLSPLRYGMARPNHRWDLVLPLLAGLPVAHPALALTMEVVRLDKPALEDGDGDEGPLVLARTFPAPVLVPRVLTHAPPGVLSGMVRALFRAAHHPLPPVGFGQQGEEGMLPELHVAPPLYYVGVLTPVAVLGT